MAEVRLESVARRYGRHYALGPLDLRFPPRCLSVIVGPSGSGKSTLLKLISGLEMADSGDILIGGRPVGHLPPGRRNIAMVFQSYALYPHMTVFGNLAFPLRNAGLPRDRIRARVAEVAARLQLQPLLERRPQALSGGQQQRVAIGRAMVREPAVYLFDEPLSNLDAALRLSMRDEIARLQQSMGATMLYVTHDQAEAMTLADRLVVMSDGRVEQAGAPLELYRRPANLFVARFLGMPPMNLLEGQVAARSGGIAEIAVGGQRLCVPAAQKMPPGHRVILGIRPEHLVVNGDTEPEAAPLPARVARVEALGSHAHLMLETPLGSLTAMVHGEPGAAAGGRVQFRMPAEALHLFDEDGRRIDA